MTFGQQIRLLGAAFAITAAIINSMMLALIGLCTMATGVVLHIDNLEKRVKALEEPKEGTSNDEN